jgi:hypothetical protein
MNPDGTGQTNLSRNPANETQPAWSSDGTQIAFASARRAKPVVHPVLSARNEPGLSENPCSASFRAHGWPEHAPHGSGESS